MVHQGRDLGVRVGRNKSAGKLVALHDVDQPGIILSAGMTRREQFFKHYSDFDAVRCAQRIELQRMFPNLQILVMGRARNRPVDAGETPAALSIPFPDLRWDIGIVSHVACLLAWFCQTNM